MRSSLLGLVGCLGLSVVVGCASAPAGDEAASQEGAATGTASKIVTGTYEYDLDLVVSGSHVEGKYYSQVGDPEHGGATCSFTLAGTIQNINGVEHARITATDAWTATSGELIATEKGVTLKLGQALNACWRSSPELSEPNGYTMDSRAALSTGADSVGFRSVKADKAFFYDRAGGNPRAAYVLQSDIVVLTGAEQNGFVPVKYIGKSTTKGFLKTADLMETFAPNPADKLQGSYIQDANDGTEGNFEVFRSDDKDMVFSLSIVNKFGGHNMGDISMEHAKLAGNVATWQGDGCTVTLTFSPDGKKAEANQEGTCGDFGFNVRVGGTWTRQ